MVENQLHITNAIMGGKESIFKLSDDRFLIVDTVSLIKFCIEREGLEVDECDLGSVDVEKLTYDGKCVTISLGVVPTNTGVIAPRVEMPYNEFLDFILRNGKYFVMAKEIKQGKAFFNKGEDSVVLEMPNGCVVILDMEQFENYFE